MVLRRRSLARTGAHMEQTLPGDENPFFFFPENFSIIPLASSVVTLGEHRRDNLHLDGFWRLRRVPEEGGGGFDGYQKRISPLVFPGPGFNPLVFPIPEEDPEDEEQGVSVGTLPKKKKRMSKKI